MCPKEFIRDIRGTMVSDLGISVVGQRAAVAALETKPDWLPGLVDTAVKNQGLIKNAVDKVDGAELPVYPSAASMMVIDIAEHNANPLDIQDKLLYENDIFVRAGNYVSTKFGDNFIRVSFSILSVHTRTIFHVQCQLQYCRHRILHVQRINHRNSNCLLYT